MAAAKRHNAVRVRVRNQEVWTTPKPVCTFVYRFLVMYRCGSAILRARDAEEALGALKGGLARAVPDSFMLWLHR